VENIQELVEDMCSPVMWQERTMHIQIWNV